VTIAFALVDTSGSVHALDATTGVNVLLGERGLGAPPIAVLEDKLPYAPGTALRRISTGPAVIELPVEIAAATTALLDALLDTVRGWLLPGTERSSSPGTVFLRVTRSDGAQREIEAVYAGGLEGDGAAGVDTWQDAVLTLRAPDPYWRDVTATTFDFTSGEGISSWFPYWPYNLTPSAVFAEQSVTNSGQAEAWPVWTITGPGTDPTLTNLTTGEVLALDLALGAGDVVTIDTSERGAKAKTIADQDGANLWPFASPTSVLWPLERGLNSIRVEMGNTDGSSSVDLSYRRRWAGGLR
jgi:hypothetical protein